MEKKILIVLILLLAVYIAFAGGNNKTKLNNPFNIKRTTYPYAGKVIGNFGTFEHFENIQFSVAAYLSLLQRNYFKLGFNTLEKIVYKYAPPEENDTKKYISDLSNETGFAPDEVLKFDFNTMWRICKAQAKLESSYKLDYNTFLKGWIMYKFYKTINTLKK